jgi:nuclear transport factor 2 (NTF2) superfamily protein
VVRLVKQSRKEEVMSTRPPLSPFTRCTAVQKVRLAEDGWNSRDPEKVALAYTLNSRWRNRAEFASGRQEIVAFLTRFATVQEFVQDENLDRIL